MVSSGLRSGRFVYEISGGVTLDNSMYIDPDSGAITKYSLKNGNVMRQRPTGNPFDFLMRTKLMARSVSDPTQRLRATTAFRELLAVVGPELPVWELAALSS